MSESNTQSVSSDPYNVLTQGVKQLQNPLNNLLETHDDILIQNSSIMNNLSAIPQLTKKIESSSTKK